MWVERGTNDAEGEVLEGFGRGGIDRGIALWRRAGGHAERKGFFVLYDGV